MLFALGMIGLWFCFVGSVLMKENVPMVQNCDRNGEPNIFLSKKDPSGIVKSDE
jgi:hypothetical protein